MTEVRQTRLAISIVLYRPDPLQLTQTLISLRESVADAIAAGSITDARLIIIDHSPRAAHEKLLENWP